MLVFDGFDEEGRIRWRFNAAALRKLRGEDPPQVREPVIAYAGSAVASGEMITGEVPVPYG